MTRRITLTLGESTTETHCGDCPLRSYCLGRRFFDNGWSPLRTDDCRAAEVKEEDDAE